MSLMLLDLFCGNGGWAKAFQARGWMCVGVDLADFSAVYPGAFLQADARSLSVQFMELFDGVVASPPCEEYTRAHLPWLRFDKTPDPGAVSLLEWSVDLARRLPIPVVVECSRFAAKHVAGAVLPQSWAFWGDVPLLLPHGGKKADASEGPARSSIRAEVPGVFGNWLASVWSEEAGRIKTTVVPGRIGWTPQRRRRVPA